MKYFLYSRVYDQDFVGNVDGLNLIAASTDGKWVGDRELKILHPETKSRS